MLSLIKSQNVDAILVAGHETEILNFIRQAKSLNVNPEALFVHRGRAQRGFPQGAWQGRQLRFRHDRLGCPRRRLRTSGSATPSNSLAEYQKRSSVTSLITTPHPAVADVEAFVKAIEAAGSTDPQKVRDAHRQGRLRQPVWPYSLQRQRPDQPAADRCPDPEGQDWCRSTAPRASSKSRLYPMPA